MSRVTEIRYIGYGVTDLAAERAFYRDVWGLVEVAERDGHVYFATRGHEEHHVVRLRQSDDNRVDVVALATATRATPANFAVEYTSDLEEVDDDSWQAQVHEPGALVMDQWGIATGGIHTMPKPKPDPGLFQAAEA